MSSNCKGPSRRSRVTPTGGIPLNGCGCGNLRGDGASFRRCRRSGRIDRRHLRSLCSPAVSRPPAHLRARLARVVFALDRSPTEVPGFTAEAGTNAVEAAVAAIDAVRSRDPELLVDVVRLEFGAAGGPADLGACLAAGAVLPPVSWPPTPAYPDVLAAVLLAAPPAEFELPARWDATVRSLVAPAAVALGDGLRALFTVTTVEDPADFSREVRVAVVRALWAAIRPGASSSGATADAARGDRGR